jgi:2,4-dienoyl-CoA reductase-like NADH-dependent reductase (Old Yellow Enzyme family)
MACNQKPLFEERAIGSKTAPSRLVVHPLERNDGTPEGRPSESAFEWYRRLAAGRWGILFVECTTCSEDPAERGGRPDGFLMNEETLPYFKRLVSEIREISPDTVVMIQLGSGSVGLDREGNSNFMSLTASKIDRLLENMIRGGILAAEAGFDGMDFKCCHGFFGYQILSTANKRHDKWGGETLRQRARFVIEGVRGIRRGLSGSAKDEFIMGARISEPNLANLKEIVEVFDGELGMDFLSVSHFPGAVNPDAMWIMAQAVKMMSSQAAVMQAGFTACLANDGSPVKRMKQALEQPLAPDFVGFGRQAIADPLTLEKLRNGQSDNINWCKRCDACFELKHCKFYHY